MESMTSSRPYLLRALYDWIVDNGLTPYLLINTEMPGVQVPAEHINNGKIVLNVAPEAVQSLVIGDADVSFSARFGGRPMQVSFPVCATLASYTRENGRGMVFGDDDDTPPEPVDDKPSRQPSLRVVK